MAWEMHGTVTNDRNLTTQNTLCVPLFSGHFLKLCCSGAVRCTVKAVFEGERLSCSLDCFLCTSVLSEDLMID